jgi:hypothetical protein
MLEVIYVLELSKQCRLYDSKFRALLKAKENFKI